MLKITIYNEFIHEKTDETCRSVYPEGIHGALAGFLKEGFPCSVRTFSVDDVNTALTDEVLSDTDVLIWWGHMAHDKVSDEVAELVYRHVQMGMGAVFLHSAHESKPFKRLMGTPCTLRWREAGEHERLWVVDPIHPIAKDVSEFIELPQEETYGEFFDIPEPDALVFLGWFSGGNVFRSGCAYKRGLGRVFYFQPGHETFPTYYIPEIQKIICNAVQWVAPSCRSKELKCIHEEISPEQRYLEQK